MAKYINKRVSKGYKDLRDFEQQAEFNKDIVDAIKSEGKKNRAEVNRIANGSSYISPAARERSRARAKELKLEKFNALSEAEQYEFCRIQVKSRRILLAIFCFPYLMVLLFRFFVNKNDNFMDSPFLDSDLKKIIKK